jgi:hypothetical protein
MLPPVNSTTPDQGKPVAQTLSIEIEPSPSLILDMVHLMKNHNRQNQALELCQMALKYFPKDMGLRLGMALAYMDLNEKEKGRAEILAVAQEIKDIAPSMDMVGRYLQKVGETRLSEWFTQVSNTLVSYPNDEHQELPDLQPPQEKAAPIELKPSPDPLLSQADLSFALREQGPEESEREEKGPQGSQVMATLNDWLTQLKGGKGKEKAE